MYRSILIGDIQLIAVSIGTEMSSILEGIFPLSSFDAVCSAYCLLISAFSANGNSSCRSSSPRKSSSHSEGMFNSSEGLSLIFDDELRYYLILLYTIVFCSLKSLLDGRKALLASWQSIVRRAHEISLAQQRGKLKRVVKMYELVRQGPEQTISFVHS